MEVVMCIVPEEDVLSVYQEASELIEEGYSVIINHASPKRGDYGSRDGGEYASCWKSLVEAFRKTADILPNGHKFIILVAHKRVTERSMS